MTASADLRQRPFRILVNKAIIALLLNRVLSQMAQIRLLLLSCLDYTLCKLLNCCQESTFALRLWQTSPIPETEKESTVFQDHSVIVGYAIKLEGVI